MKTILTALLSLAACTGLLASSDSAFFSADIAHTQGLDRHTLAPTGDPLITYFNFEDDNLISDPAVPAPLQASTITHNFVATNVGFLNGTTINVAPGNVQIANHALSLQVGTAGANNGHWIQFTINSIGLQSLVLSYATQTSNLTSGFNLQSWSYSTDGTTFTPFGQVVPGTSFALATLNLPAGANNQTTLILRDTFTGGSTTSSTSNNRLDNIQVNGILAEVPEPSTVFAGALAIGALIWMQRRRLFGVAQMLSNRA